MMRTELLMVKDRYPVIVDVLSGGRRTGQQVPGKALAHKYNGSKLFAIQVSAQFGDKSRTAWCNPKFIHKAKAVANEHQG